MFVKTKINDPNRQLAEDPELVIAPNVNTLLSDQTRRVGFCTFPQIGFSAKRSVCRNQYAEMRANYSKLPQEASLGMMTMMMGEREREFL